MTVHPSVAAFQHPASPAPPSPAENTDVMIHSSYLQRPQGTQLGFTLIELLVAVAVAAVILAVGVPSFQGSIASSRLSTQTNDLVSALSLARTESIRRGDRVTLCKSADGSTCTNTGDWSQGWITFVDTTRSGTSAQVDTGETILARQSAGNSNVSAKGSTDLANYVSYAPDGRTKLMNGDPQSGTLRVCASSSALTNDARARSILISAVGRVTTIKPTGIADTCPAP